MPSKPVHESYQRHRREVTTQIVLPMILTAILFLAVVGFLIATLVRGTGDIARWAAVSTIWIFAPLIVVSLIFVVLLVGIIYLLARLLGIIPHYTSQAQDFVRKLGARIQHAADIPVRPVIFLDSIGASIKALFGRK